MSSDASPVYTCGTCGRSWDYPTPASRCPFEYDHAETPDLTGMVTVPPCGLWIVRWEAEHPDHGHEHGAMLVDAIVHGREIDEFEARNRVAEVLWGQGYTGDYTTAAEEVTP